MENINCCEICANQNKAGCNCWECTKRGGKKDLFISKIPMPPVTPPKEEINHPERYNTGGVECIDVMVKIFGVKAVKIFCKLNAFKYIWREQHKNGVEDIKKAIWYLKKYVELSQDNDE